MHWVILQLPIVRVGTSSTFQTSSWPPAYHEVSCFQTVAMGDSQFTFPRSITQLRQPEFLSATRTKNGTTNTDIRTSAPRWRSHVAKSYQNPGVRYFVKAQGSTSMNAVILKQQALGTALCTAFPPGDQCSIPKRLIKNLHCVLHFYLELVLLYGKWPLQTHLILACRHILMTALPKRGRRRESTSAHVSLCSRRGNLHHVLKHGKTNSLLFQVKANGEGGKHHWWAPQELRVPAALRRRYNTQIGTVSRAVSCMATSSVVRE